MVREKPAQARRGACLCVVSGRRRFLEVSSFIMTDVVDRNGAAMNVPTCHALVQKRKRSPASPWRMNSERGFSVHVGEKISMHSGDGPENECERFPLLYRALFAEM